MTECTKQRKSVETQNGCRLAGIAAKLVIICTVSHIVSLLAIVTTALAQTGPRQPFDIDGITFRIPTYIQWKSSVNTVTHEQTLELFVPTQILKTGFSDVQGRKKDSILLVIRSDIRRLGSLYTHSNIIRGKTPEIFGQYELYPAGGFDFYVSPDKSHPHFFWCEVKKVGVLEGQPRLCHVIEDINGYKNLPKETGPTSVEYMFTFEDIPNLHNIDRDITELLSSMIIQQD